PTIYTPLSQRGGAWSLSLFIRTAGEPEALLTAVRKTVAELAPPSTTQTVETMDDMIKRSFSEERYRALLISLFAAFAAVPAAVGIYGVASRSVARRTRELAIRAALGATSRSIASAAVGATLAGGAAGVVIGLAIAA